MVIVNWIFFESVPLDKSVNIKFVTVTLFPVKSHGAVVGQGPDEPYPIRSLPADTSNIVGFLAGSVNASDRDDALIELTSEAFRIS